MPKRYFQINCTSQTAKLVAKRNLEKKILSGMIESSHKQNKLNLQKISVDSSTISAKKSGGVIEHDDFKRITGTKIHVAVNQNGLPIPITIMSSANHFTLLRIQLGFLFSVHYLVYLH